MNTDFKTKKEYEDFILADNANYRGEVWQGGMLVAIVEGRGKKSIEREIAHYAMMYRQDGPVETKIMREGAERRLQRENR